ncbi:MAG: hypothetical protein H7039_18900, partial [Bryobacteraceae bacterium]|nr:hypothetical protein [Bryobacteraceae bacterium]
MKLVRRVFAIVMSGLPFVALLSLFLYPVYKQQYAGWLLVVAGLAVAWLPQRLPRLVELVRDTTTAMPAVRWLMLLTLVALVLRLPLLLAPPEPHSDTQIYVDGAKNIAAGKGY